MSSRFSNRLFLTLAPFFLLTSLVPLRAGEGSGSPAGSVRLSSGLTARYEYHFNRNSLRDSQRAGRALITLTNSGNLLRFEVASLKLTREWYGPTPITCLGRGANGTVLAGFEDGRICRVDPETLVPTVVARLSGKPQWVVEQPVHAEKGTPPRILAVVEKSKRVERGRQRGQTRYSEVHDLASGKSFPLEDRATAFLLDSKRQLWLGADNGEWGGWCSVLDLTTGTIRSIPGLKIFEHDPDKEYWRGVYGFFERDDGQVWAYGGTNHMGSTDGFISRVEEGRAEELYFLDAVPGGQKQFNNDELAGGREADEGPDAPITSIVQDPQTRALVIMSLDYVYRTDENLKRWKATHRLHIRYRSGRPDAMGAYPSVRSVHLLEGTNHLICGTRMDGIVLLDGHNETASALPGQLELEEIDRIENTKEGTLVVESYGGDRPWQIQKGNWVQRDFAPPIEPVGKDVKPDPADEADSWSTTRLLVGPDGSLFSVSAGRWTPGMRATARWRNGKAEILGWEKTDLNPEACFVTPDGKLWNAGYDSLRQFMNGKWTVVSTWDPAVRRGELTSFGWGLRAVNEVGPPWILLDHRNKTLVRLHLDPKTDLPPRAMLKIREGERVLAIHEALPLTRETLLLATDQGLRTFEIASGKISPPVLPVLDRKVKRLCRDGLGRLWMGGDGLVMIDPGGKTLHAFDALPMLGRSPIDALATDPSHPEGVVVAMGTRGLIFIQARPAP
jgi:hypothetical protein